MPGEFNESIGLLQFIKKIQTQVIYGLLALPKLNFIHLLINKVY